MKRHKKTKQQPEEAAKRQRVYSYYSATNHQLNTYQRQTGQSIKKETFRRRLRLIARNWFLILIGVVLATLFIYSLIFKQEASLTIDGTKYRKIQTYETIVNELLASSWLNSTKVTINKNKLSEELKKALPEASSVKISVPALGNRPDITILTDSALAVFANTENDKYVLSGKGRVLLPVGESTENIGKLPVVSNNTEIRLSEGQQFMTPAQAEALNKLIFQTGGSSAVTYEVPIQPQEIIMRDNASGSYFVRFLLDPETIEQQYGAYLALRSRFSQDKPSEYIDARLADKIFVK